jgi:hypothetical protein
VCVGGRSSLRGPYHLHTVERRESAQIKYKCVTLGPGSPLIAFDSPCLSPVLPILTRLISNPYFIFNEGGKLTLTKYVYIKSTTVYGRSPRWNWDSPNPSLASECALPPRTKWGGGAHSPAGEGLGGGGGGPNSDDWRKSLALCLLSAYTPQYDQRWAK